MSSFPFPQKLSPKLIQCDQIPDTLKSTEVIDPGMGGFALPVKKTNQCTGGETGTFASGKQLEQALAGLAPPNITLPIALQVLQTYPLHEDVGDETKPNPFQSNVFAAPPNLKLRQAIPGAAAASVISQGTAAAEAKYDIAPIQNEIDFTQVNDPLLKRNIKNSGKGRCKQAS